MSGEIVSATYALIDTGEVVRLAEYADGRWSCHWYDQSGGWCCGVYGRATAAAAFARRTVRAGARVRAVRADGVAAASAAVPDVLAAVAARDGLTIVS